MHSNYAGSYLTRLETESQCTLWVFYVCAYFCFLSSILKLLKACSTVQKIVIEIGKPCSTMQKSMTDIMIEIVVEIGME